MLLQKKCIKHHSTKKERKSDRFEAYEQSELTGVEVDTVLQFLVKSHAFSAVLSVVARLRELVYKQEIS